MPFASRRARLEISHEDITWLTQLIQSRSEAAGRVQRAEILRRYNRGETVSSIASVLGTNRPKVERGISKALQLSVRMASYRRHSDGWYDLGEVQIE